MSLRELEELDTETIRQYLVMLRELNKPTPRESRIDASKQQTPYEMKNAIMASIGHLKG